jgi:hypothetical protein
MTPRPPAAPPSPLRGEGRGEGQNAATPFTRHNTGQCQEPMADGCASLAPEGERAGVRGQNDSGRRTKYTKPITAATLFYTSSVRLPTAPLSKGTQESRELGPRRHSQREADSGRLGYPLTLSLSPRGEGTPDAPSREKAKTQGTRCAAGDRHDTAAAGCAAPAKEHKAAGCASLSPRGRGDVGCIAAGKSDNPRHQNRRGPQA